MHIQLPPSLNRIDKIPEESITGLFKYVIKDIKTRVRQSCTAELILRKPIIFVSRGNIFKILSGSGFLAKDIEADWSKFTLTTSVKRIIVYMPTTIEYENEFREFVDRIDTAKASKGLDENIDIMVLFPAPSKHQMHRWFEQMKWTEQRISPNVYSREGHYVFRGLWAGFGPILEFLQENGILTDKEMKDTT